MGTNGTLIILHKLYLQVNPQAPTLNERVAQIEVKLKNERQQKQERQRQQSRLARIGKLSR